METKKKPLELTPVRDGYHVGNRNPMRGRDQI